ncbi:MAG: excinuclease ABC subunit A [Parcubacteria group bacterium Gr01-1014_29]|nr:MAG: excinuclease ABC subunit A [Parcubacteria group bacterium Gr01-1014_29]
MPRKKVLPKEITPSIQVRGARVHNLKNISVDIPRNKFVVITGLSGSGKSSLAFDTIYAEAERRFVESLSAYARQFLGIKEKPDVDSIEGLSPAISIDQKSVSRNPRSTVGTITEIYDYLRILFARVGEPHCPQCGNAVKKQTIDEMITKILAYPEGTSVSLLAPVIRGRKGEHKIVLEEISRKGFSRVRLDGTHMRIQEALSVVLDPQKKHSLDVVVDRLVLDSDIDRPRFADSLETALGIGKGIVIVEKGATDHLFSEHFACPACSVSLPELEPRLFSFNSPYGACPTCTGIGHTLEVDPERVFPNKNLTLAEGAIQPWARASHRVGRQSWYWWMLEDLAHRHTFSLTDQVRSLPKRVQDIILYGEPLDSKKKETFEGVIPHLKRRWKETDSEWTRAEIEKYMHLEMCPACKGTRLKPETLAVRLNGKNIAEVSSMGVEDAVQFFQNTEKVSSLQNKKVVSPLVKEIIHRLNFLTDVGLEYVTLDRESTTLSGGEAQRVRLATQIGSRLTGVTYVLDEPSIGLHPRDHHRLIETLKRLRDLGNTILVVEHDRDTMNEADWIIDLGPGAGKHGGMVIFTGTPSQLRAAATSTGHYLSGRKKIIVGTRTRIPSSSRQKYLRVRGAAGNNLKNIDVQIPLGVLACVGGVSGSGKSTLVNDTIGRALMQHFYRSKDEPAAHDSLEGTQHLDKVVIVDQSPIGRTPRSNPATYTGAFTFIRDLFSHTQEARARGYRSGRFSFNVKGGRCEVCEGQGVRKIEMYFLPDIYIECEECHGKRYNQEALAILYNNESIADVLEMSIEEACDFFKDIPAIWSRLTTLVQVGLGYMQLGQPATTLSGGEAQRVKLATELAKKATGQTMYILDEPTTGLHFEDIRRLLEVLNALVTKGNSVLVIEHNIDVLKNADWIIELGPEGGPKGGYLIAEGTPADIRKIKKSPTGQWL